MTPTNRMLSPPRADLYQAPVDRVVVLGVYIHTSSVASGVRPDGTLVMESGEELRADLALVANGAYPQLRKQILRTTWIDFGIEAGIRMMIDGRPRTRATSSLNTGTALGGCCSIHA